jgi:type VI secretion system protein ImpK
MSTLTPVRSETALVGGFATANRTSTSGIRDLLRDTGLLVVQLSQGGHTNDAATLRQRCQQLMAGFSAALDLRGFASDVCEDAEYAQCGLLDEAVLHNLSAENKPIWDAQPLQVERFGKHDAGERVFERLEQRMRERSPNIELLECYATILGLGFMGRYASPWGASFDQRKSPWDGASPKGTSFGASEGEAKRSALIASLNAQLEKLRLDRTPLGSKPVVSRPFVTDRTGRRLADWFYRLSPWAIAGLACVAAAVIWLIWAPVLDAQFAHLAPAATRP